MKQKTFHIDVTVKWEEYPTKKLNQAVERDIRRWLKSLLEGHIPFYVEKDEHGSAIEGITRPVKTRIK